jgi:2-dehydro-3-deoxyphosphogluconate aldolase/(4S)-4-hydroxy-2-oxoglutarate aldolase
MLKDVGIIPVIRADSADVALRVVSALVDAGLPVAEITMTVPDALQAMKQVALRFSRRILLGAGTVTDAATVPQAIDAGAEFIVSPALVPEVIVAARAANVTVLPGALTPSEILQAVQWGADLVKVFPAQALGGPSYIRALRGPFPTIPLVPTGGVNLQTIGDFIRAGSAAVGVGGELVQKEAIARGDFAAIGVLAREFLQAVRSARGHPERSEGSTATREDPSSPSLRSDSSG